jgi:SAM-dependent methyltransferase
MDRDYWNRISKNYEREVLSVFDNDLQGVVEEKIAAAGVAYPRGRAVDVGCGIGRFTPLLSEMFCEVDACDFTSVGLKKAKARCRSKKNVRFYELDITKDSFPFEAVDFVFCVNVLIMPSLDSRMRAWWNVANQVERIGDGESTGSAVKNCIDEKATAADMRMGVLQLDGVRTKHYLKDEVEAMVRARHFEIVEVRKVKYPPQGDSEFATWDWLVEARRN